MIPITPQPLPIAPTSLAVPHPHALQMDHLLNWRRLQVHCLGHRQLQALCRPVPSRTPPYRRLFLGFLLVELRKFRVLSCAALGAPTAGAVVGVEVPESYALAVNGPGKLS